MPARVARGSATSSAPRRTSRSGSRPSREAGVTNLQVMPGDATTRPPRSVSSRSGSPEAVRVGLHHPRRYDIRDQSARSTPSATATRSPGWSRGTSSPGTTTRARASPSCATTASPRSPPCSTAPASSSDDGVKRYDDTLLVAEEAEHRGHRLRARPRRPAPAQPHPRPLRHPERRVPLRPRHHHRRPGRAGSEAYGWRDLEPVERQALANLTTRFGELMGIQDLPTTYDGYLDPAASTTRPSASRSPRPTSGSPRPRSAIGRAVAPLPLKPFARRVTIALMDEPLRDALGMPEQPAWFVAAVRRGLRARARAAALRSPAPYGVPPPADDVPARLLAARHRPALDARRTEPSEC